MSHTVEFKGTGEGNPREILDKFLELYGLSVESQYNGEYTEYHINVRTKDNLWRTLEVMTVPGGYTERDAYLLAMNNLLDKLGIK